MKNNRLYIAMVGLPARGKSTIATKLKESLVNESVKTRIFNNGDLRRKMIRGNTSYARFFDSNNSEGVAIREKIALTNMERAQKFLNSVGDVAILDASNVSRDRRECIQSRLNDHPILFIECVNNDEEILSASILRKIDLAEFGHLTREEAIKGFRERISYYQSIEEPLERERNYIRLDSLHNSIIGEGLSDIIPYYDQIRDFLVTNTVKNLYLIRHGETYYNLEDRIGGDSDLTEKGWAQARALANYFKKKKIPLIFTSQKKRTHQTASPIKEIHEDCTIIPLTEFDEINSGICECMSYEKIKAQMPHVYSARKKDKYNYVYPEGEGYVTMQERINRGIKKALYLSNPSDNIMIIGHRAVNRMILSHFMFRREEDVPFIYIPQDKFYYISTTQNKKHFQLKRFK
ncbi:MAG: Alpha-ribazole phosphatase [Candidatus Scalindua rubra]|uniref:Alpha-ribazole phosphatase n=1 Tax=Candidatus Scalindua rubra TaxID=1872076 RepID=A0A1E3XEJ8_9BACT|nr:MAG: Alpha-ribazole phosphatase [Candidatus Scalindua rubra]